MEAAGWRQHLVAAGVSAHLLAITLMALPNAAGGLDRQAWRDPTVQAELDRWATRVAFLGIDRPTLEADAFAFAERSTALRDTVLRPFKPYYRYCGTWQSWKMFVAPHTHPTRLRIEVERGGRWEMAFVERSPDLTWLGRELGHDRMRAVIFRIGWPQYGPLRRDFTRWVARRAAADFPDATRVRVSFLKEDTLPAAAARAGNAEPHAVVLPTVQPVPR